MKAVLLPVLLAGMLLPMALLTGCASVGQGADAVADNLTQGLEGKGHLYNERVMKGDMGGAFGNDFQ